MASKIRLWFNERLSFGSMFQSAFDEDIPGGSSFFYALGSATLFVFALQVLTGVWQLFYYVPTVDHAYDSLSYLRLSVPYGWLIQGIHYWGANLMIVLIGLHILRVFVWGAHKKPRELTWLIGILLLLLVVGLVFTGAALPWDERGYWAAEVGTSIAGTVPFIGKWLIEFLRGGESMSQLTLSRFFVFHTAILPGITFLIVAFHLMAFRKYGSVGPWQKSKRLKTGAFWPNQVGKDLIISALILILLIGLSVYSPAPFTGRADPLDASFQPKPEWNFLFLYQTLKMFTGSTELIGTVGIPTLIILILVLVPFIDRKKDFNPLKRPGMMIGGFVFITGIVILTVIGYYSKPPGSKSSAKIVKKTEAIKLSSSALMGKSLYDAHACSVCHKMSGQGGVIGPDLTKEHKRGRSKDWIITQIKSSKKHYPHSIMPSFTMLSDMQLNNLADFLLSPHAKAPSALANSNLPNPPKPSSNKTQEPPNNYSPGVNATLATKLTSEALAKLNPPGAAADIIGNVAHGALLFRLNCESCHGVKGRGGIPNPGSFLGQIPSLNPISKKLFSKSPQEFANNIDRFIQHGSLPAGRNPVLKMFDYGDSHTYTQPEIADMEAYILYLNGVNRAKIEVPGSAPKQFFMFSVAIVLLVVVILLIIWAFDKKKN